MSDRRRHSKGVLKGILREGLTVVLVLALLAPALGVKERREAQVIVTKRDGTVVQGELLAVRDANVIIMDRSTSGGITVGLQEIQEVKVVRSSKVLKKMGKGFLFGGLIGAGLGFLAWDPDAEGFVLQANTRAGNAMLGAIVVGVVGTMIGGIAGGFSGIDKKITIHSATPEDISRLVVQLRPLARERS